MKITFPHTIENCMGEKLIFHSLQTEAGGDKLMVENFILPGGGPPMHTHWQQDEALTVVQGRMGYQVQGGPEAYAGPGESVSFKRGTPHRFWNDGKDVLQCTGWIQPANSIVFFLTSIYAAQNKSRNAQPEKFDAAYLLYRYSGEFDMPAVPKFVKRVIFPATYFIGKVLGKYKHFRDAPEPLITKKLSK